MNKPEYAWQATVQMTLVRRVPDRRYKSGYREVNVSHKSFLNMQNGVQTQTIADHITKDGKVATRHQLAATALVRWDNRDFAL